MYLTSHPAPASLTRSGGYSLIEVMITIFVIAVGLMGLAGLQARALNAEIESVSRGQALMLANDLADRMAANIATVKTPVGAATYNQHSGGGTTVYTTGLTKTIFGSNSGNDCVTVANNTSALQAACCAAKATTAERDLCEWDLSLRGISEATSGGTVRIGAMSEARGCVFLQATNVYQVDVVWRGRDSTGAVASDLTCGSAEITTRRRGVSRRLRVADLDGT